MTGDELIEKLLMLTPEQRKLEVWGDERDGGPTQITTVEEIQFQDAKYSTHTEPGERVIWVGP